MHMSILVSNKVTGYYSFFMDVHDMGMQFAVDRYDVVSQQIKTIGAHDFLDVASYVRCTTFDAVFVFPVAILCSVGINAKMYNDALIKRRIRVPS